MNRQTERIKSVIKTIIGPSPETSKLVKMLTKLSEDLRENVKRSKEFHETFRALADWMASQSKSVSDLNYTQKANLMKFVKNTWMPIDEGHFATIVDEAGKYQYTVYKKALDLCTLKRVAIDVGANIGLFTRQMSEDFGAVHAFEPQYGARACILRNTPKNNVTVYSYGLGEKDAELELKSISTAIGGAFIKESAESSTELKKSETVKHEKVLIRRLDDFNFPHIDLVKIDVQGFEIDVLKGGANTFKSCKPVLILEAGGKVEAISGVNPKDALDYAINELGYTIKDVVNKDYILV